MNSSHKILMSLGICLVLSSCFEKQNSQVSIPKFCQIDDTHKVSICSFTSQQLRQNLALYWQNPATGTPFLTFSTLKAHLDDHQKTLQFAMNAGMYDEYFSPIGHTIIDGQMLKSLNLKTGQGNFHLMPNGVFWWGDDGIFVDTSTNFAQKIANGTRPKYATQSGPMLVIDGQIHPAFDKDSTSAKHRNGVGTQCADGLTHFVITNQPMTFYAFASVFQDKLGCQNALFLDGGVASALYAPNLKRFDTLNMGVMIGFASTK